MKAWSTFYRQNHRNVEENREKANDIVDMMLMIEITLTKTVPCSSIMFETLLVKVELETFAIIIW